MTKYRSYTITKTATTIGPELHGRGGGRRYLYKIEDKDGFAERNHMGNLPLITSVASARAYIDNLLKAESEIPAEAGNAE